MSKYLASVAAIALASCSGADDDAKPLPVLTDEQAAARNQDCMAQIAGWRDRGVWKHGGVKPGVDTDAWDNLSDADQAEMLDIAACIKANGQYGPQEIELTREGFTTPWKTIEAENAPE